MEELVQGSREWLEVRKKCITATDSVIIMGVSPWKTKYQLFEEKLGFKEPIANEAMQRGTRLEPFARYKLEQLFGFALPAKVAFHAMHKWIMSSLDAFNAEKKILVEIKCPGRVDHQLAVEGKIPEKYIPQMQHQMFTTDMREAYYYSFDGTDGVIVPVQRDDNYIEEMFFRECKFHDCMLSLEPPELCPQDYVEHRDSAWYHLVQQYQSAKLKREAAEKDEETYREAILARTEGQNCIGAGIKVSKIIRKGNVDYKKIEVLQGVDLESYRKDPIVSWRIANE